MISEQPWRAVRRPGPCPSATLRLRSGQALRLRSGQALRGRVVEGHRKQYNYQLSTLQKLEIDNKLKPKRNKAFLVSAIFCGDIRHELNFEFLNFEF